MRIITGSMRGKRLQTPAGMHTRPTTEKVKESIFNIIQFEIEGKHALDLFCGSGQMGLEALSRGALTCDFVDNDKNAAQATRSNIQACGFGERSSFQLTDYTAHLQRAGRGRYGLIFLDPPYGGAVLNDALSKIVQIDILAPSGIIICEYAKNDEIMELPPPYRRLKEYRYGQTSVATITRDEV